jgi:hypothetical protein
MSRWGLNKNVRKHEMEAIVRKLQHRRVVEPEKGHLQFSVRGKIVESKQISNWMKRYNVIETETYIPNSGASESSA